MDCKRDWFCPNSGLTDFRKGTQGRTAVRPYNSIAKCYGL